ncbi:MAG: hypothetical protein IIA72_25340 [Proteobacteria bacterium]|nr:hypothetical protein [Pseudomonadota bacterium]
MTEQTVGVLYEQAEKLVQRWESPEVSDAEYFQAVATMTAIDLLGIIQYDSADSVALAMRMEMLAGHLGLRQEGTSSFLLGEQV